MTATTSFRSLHTLRSLDEDKIALLRDLDVTNLGDLLAYPPIRHAGLVRAARDGLLSVDEITDYLDERARSIEISELVLSSAEHLRSVNDVAARILSKLGADSIGELADFAPFVEAEEAITRGVTEESDPNAPPCVLPTCKKFTRNSKSYVSFFKHEEIRNLSVLTTQSFSLLGKLFRFTGSEPRVIYLGYSVSYLQDWIYGGVHLGEPQGSVSLFMGQDTQVSVLDWKRLNSALRQEDTRVTEKLSSTLFHQRAVDEVARATAEEHQYGGTSAFGANAATAGSFVAAGAVVGGVGGGISGALTGLVLGNVANAAAGAPTIAGAAIGTAVGSIAGAAAGSLIVSGATTLGFVETDAEGDREIFAKSAQNIQQRTVQNSSSIRSFWSNIVSQSVQEEEQRVRTDRVTNHNRIHALNALYFEVLNAYRLNITANDFAPILFLPFRPFTFTELILARYWWIIRTVLADPSLVLALDAHYLTVSSEPSPADALAELPAIEDVETREIEVKLNLDGSKMESIVEGIVGGVLLGAAMAVFNALWMDGKRDKIRVSVLTSAGVTPLARVGSPNADPNFVGRYRTTTRVPIHSIDAILVTNDNDEFSIEGLGFEFDLNQLAFDDLKVRIEVAGKADLTAALPEIGSLETEQLVAEDFLVGANSSTELAWGIGQQLRDQFEGVDGLVAELTGELAAQELLEVKRANLLSFLNANKFGFTRLILQSIEREQLTTVLEDVQIGGFDLSDIAGTTPLGFCGNHVVLPLKNRRAAADGDGPIEVDTSKLVERLRKFADVALGDTVAVTTYANSTLAFLNNFLGSDTSERPPSQRELQLRELVSQLIGLLRQVPQSRVGVLAIAPQVGSAVNRVLAFLDAPTQTSERAMLRLRGYYDAVKQALSPRMGKLISSEEISLPSPAVFMEPVLSQAKGAELYDMRRNSHYEILPAPGIGDADPNVIRGRDDTLVPNIPVAGLTIQNAPEFALPTSLVAALAEAGRLDLGTLLTTNAGTLNSTLSNLSTMATELAKASSQLTGAAQQQTLAAASDVAKQVGELVQKSLESPKPAPPQGQQAKAETAREVRRITSGGGSKAQKTEEKETIGVPTTPDGTRDYQMGITFLDAQGAPYSTGEFTLTMAFFEFGTTVDFNGGAPIEMTGGQFMFPERITLQQGRAAKISISANMASATIDGLLDFTLPDRPDISFRARMRSETRKVVESNAKTAVDTAVAQSSFSAGVSPMLSQFLNAGVEFPFKLAKVTANGGGKIDLPFRVEYNRSSSDTDGNTTVDSTVTEFEVSIPTNSWIIEVA